MITLFTSYFVYKVTGGDNCGCWGPKSFAVENVSFKGYGSH